MFITLFRTTNVKMKLEAGKTLLTEETRHKFTKKCNVENKIICATKNAMNI